MEGRLRGLNSNMLRWGSAFSKGHDRAKAVACRTQRKGGSTANGGHCRHKATNRKSGPPLSSRGSGPSHTTMLTRLRLPPPRSRRVNLGKRNMSKLSQCGWSFSRARGVVALAQSAAFRRPDWQPCTVCLMEFSFFGATTVTASSRPDREQPNCTSKLPELLIATCADPKTTSIVNSGCFWAGGMTVGCISVTPAPRLCTPSVYLLRLHLLEFSAGRRAGWSCQESIVYTCWTDAVFSQFSF